MYGYDIGATSYAVFQLQDPEHAGVDWHHYLASSSPLVGFITALSTLGALVGSLLCFSVTEIIGRRQEIILASCLYIIGAFVEWASGAEIFDNEYALGLYVLISGRFIYGLGIGFAMHGVSASRIWFRHMHMINCIFKPSLSWC